MMFEYYSGVEPIQEVVSYSGSIEQPPIPFFVGLDLGQAHDYTAIAILEKIKQQRQVPDPQHPGQLKTEDLPALYHCRHLARMPLGTLYPTVVEEVKNMMNSPQLKDQTMLAADATGVGRPVVNMLAQAGIKYHGVSITAGDAESKGDDGLYRVPKRELVSRLQVLLQSDRLKLGKDLPLAATLTQELLNFQVKITTSANETYGAWREGSHDDLVLALALAAWLGEKFVPFRVCWA